jgi:hypothetical protein
MVAFFIVGDSPSSKYSTDRLLIPQSENRINLMPDCKSEIGDLPFAARGR